MKIREQPLTNLEEYARIPITFEAHSALDVSPRDGGLGGAAATLGRGAAGRQGGERGRGAAGVRVVGAAAYGPVPALVGRGLRRAVPRRRHAVARDDGPAGVRTQQQELVCRALLV